MWCPSCTTVHLDRDGTCHQCQGIWISEDQIAERVADPVEYTGGRLAQRRRCPVCEAPMDEPLVFDVSIDRCPPHGMWFDNAELDEVARRTEHDEWRLYSGGTHAPRKHDVLGALLEIIRAWRRKG